VHVREWRTAVSDGCQLSGLEQRRDPRLHGLQLSLVNTGPAADLVVGDDVAQRVGPHAFISAFSQETSHCLWGKTGVRDIRHCGKQPRSNLDPFAAVARCLFVCRIILGLTYVGGAALAGYVLAQAEGGWQQEGTP
jgi:hypothetical protein